MARDKHPALVREGSARIALRQKAVAYANVAGTEDDDAWDSAWFQLRDAALEYANATHEATRVRASKGSK